MFTWPSYAGPIGFPQDKARKSADELAQVLTILRDLKARDSGDRPFVLLTHRMGALVLEALPSVPAEDDLAGLFNNVVVSAAAAQYDGHWVHPVTSTESNSIRRHPSWPRGISAWTWCVRMLVA